MLSFSCIANWKSKPILKDNDLKRDVLELPTYVKSEILLGNNVINTGSHKSGFNDFMIYMTLVWCGVIIATFQKTL